MHAAQECKRIHRMFVEHLHSRRNSAAFCPTGHPCSFLFWYPQNINQLELFGDMSTPPDITSPSVSNAAPAHSRYSGYPLVLISFSNSNLHRPPPLRPAPWTPRKACSLPRSCLLPSIPRLCPQVGPRRNPSQLQASSKQMQRGREMRREIKGKSESREDLDQEGRGEKKGGGRGGGG